MRGRRLKTLFAGLVVVLAVFGGVAAAQAGSDFYKGKTVTLILPNSPSGQMTQYARMIAPFIAKHIGANAVRIKNMQGAGGVVGANYLWHAKPELMSSALLGLNTI
ncbi:MAG: hypothetical protein P8Z81_14165 [Deinococcales bacterium]